MGVAQTGKLFFRPARLSTAVFFSPLSIFPTHDLDGRGIERKEGEIRKQEGENKGKEHGAKMTMFFSVAFKI